ncbi:hypothetical protein [Nakamurella endophytica]|uniref:Uncharacterized protein n=1 Tax=Nakamurella endophytica TaxID=1748367 RepID=A0A917WK93_9ACTN|nr:hypothetical protein [Nakamurella endophytica]GGM10151.1 hypothetical protein GCM10011594_32590 [Nakamurella endophytica]
MATTSRSRRTVAVSPVLVQAARLRKVINDRRGLATSPVTQKIAALDHNLQHEPQAYPNH